VIEPELAQMATITLGKGFVLLAWWKAIVLLLPFVGWAWVVSSVYDKHAMRFHLSRQAWNIAHLMVGLVTIMAAFMLPISEPWAFLVSLAILVVVLGADLAAYPMVANRDDRVPEDHHLTLDFKSWKAARATKAEARQAGKSELAVASASGDKLPVPATETPEYAVRIAAEAVVIRGQELRASQLDIVPIRDANYVTSFLVDGVRQNGEPMPAPDALKIMDFWKTAAGLDVADRRRKQTGDFRVERGETHTKIRLTSSGGQSGMRVTLLFEPEKAVRRKPENLGLLGMQMEELKTMVAHQGGVVLIAAGPDMGGTTTLYSVLRMHDAYTSNVQTIEVDPQGQLEGVRQNRFDPTDTDREYSKLVRSILRRDPDVVGIAELPDTDTARNIAESDTDRTRTYVQLRADGVMGALQIWAKAVGDLELAARALHGVVAVKLVRKLCMNCRVPYQPSPEMLSKLGLPADKIKQLHKKGGQVLIKNKAEVCPVCNGVGYMEQTAVFEVSRFNDAERNLIAQGNLAGLRAELRKRQIPTIQQSALRKAVEGVTSVEEVTRVTAQQKRQPAKTAG